MIEKVKKAFEILKKRKVIKDELKLLDRISDKLNLLAFDIYVYPFMDHKRVSPDIERISRELEDLIKEWEAKYGKKLEEVR